MDLKEENAISERIIGAAIEVHRVLGGPGLLESVYEEALAHELKLLGMEIERQKEMPLVYKGNDLERSFRIDLLVEGSVVVEVKAASGHNPVFQSQLLTYIRLANRKLGLLINFGKPKLADGVSRVINNRMVPV